MPSGYGYGNARLRAMRSQLLTEADYRALLARANLEELITALADSPYQAEIEAVLVRMEGVRTLFEALRANLTHTLGQLRGFFEGRDMGSRGGWAKAPFPQGIAVNGEASFRDEGRLAPAHHTHWPSLARQQAAVETTYRAGAHHQHARGGLGTSNQRLVGLDRHVPARPGETGSVTGRPMA